MLNETEEDNREGQDDNKVHVAIRYNLKDEERWDKETKGVTGKLHFPLVLMALWMLRCI
jgi:hypothetical protein